MESMSNDDGERQPVGVVVKLRDMGGGKSRVTLDDVKSDSTRRRPVGLSTCSTRIKISIQKRSIPCWLPSGEYEGLVAAIMARLLALGGRVS